MVKVDLPFIQKETTRHGKVIYYYRKRPMPRVRLPDDFGSKEFMDAYWACRKGADINPPNPNHIKRKYNKDTVGWALCLYLSSAQWQANSEGYKRSQGRIYEKIREANGELPLASITKKSIQAGCEKRKAKPVVARTFLKRMKSWCNWLLSQDIIKINPCDGVVLPEYRTAGYKTWTVAELEAYRNTWAIGTMQRLSLEILFFTGLRRGDAVKLSRVHVADNVFYVRPEKARRRNPNLVVHIPVHPYLAEVIAQTKAVEKNGIKATTFIHSTLGKPYKKESFTNEFLTWSKAAGLENCTPHGLRKLAAKILAENGATEKELMAAFGWTDSRMPQIYTRAADNKQLGHAAWERMSNILPAPSKKLGQTEEKKQQFQ